MDISSASKYIPQLSTRRVEVFPPIWAIPGSSANPGPWKIISRSNATLNVVYSIKLLIEQ